VTGFVRPTRPIRARTFPIDRSAVGLIVVCTATISRRGADATAAAWRRDEKCCLRILGNICVATVKNHRSPAAIVGEFQPDGFLAHLRIRHPADCSVGRTRSIS
jgi:hypothetical protein